MIPTGSKSTIISLSMAKNEQDIIEPFIRHNLKFVDFMFVADNGSVDDTRRILAQLSQETQRVAVLDYEGFAHSQSECMTNLLLKVQSAFFADYMFLLDSDEFIGAADRNSMEKELSAIPLGSFGKLPWISHVIHPSYPYEKAKANPPISITWRRKTEREQHYKGVLRLDRKIEKNLTISVGNHQILDEHGTPLPAVVLDKVPLLHFPVRSEEQIAAKGINGWMATLAREAQGKKLGRNESFQWRQNFERAQLPGEIKKNIHSISFHYGQSRGAIDWARDVIFSDHQIEYERKYSNGTAGPPLSMVARSWEKSIRKRTPLFNIDSRVSPAIRKRLFVDIAPFRVLVDAVNPGSVLDIGCGTGAYVKLLSDMGIKRAVGVDSMPCEKTLLSNPMYRQGDVRQITGVKRKFDIVLSLGLLSKLQEDEALKLLQAMASSANDAIVFLPGSGHSDSQSLDYWLAQWSQHGWEPDVGMSLTLRAVASFSWFRRSLLLLRPQSRVRSTAFGIDILNHIDRMPFNPPKDSPAILENAFEVDPVAFVDAYL